MYEHAHTYYGQSGPPPSPGADLVSASSGLFQTTAQLTDILGEKRLQRDLEKLQLQQTRAQRRLAKRFGKKSRLDQLRTANIDSRISALQNLVEKRRRARLALWGSVAVLALVSFVAFRAPPTVRLAPTK